jgi:thiol-disulfide isomerase/thioredoxin
MLSIPLGPLALPVAPLLLLIAALCALWLARRMAGPTQAATAEAALWWSLAAALLAARLGHVALHWAAYGSQPAALLDVRDGGWFWPAGLAAGLLVLGLWAWRREPMRRALLAGGVLGLTLWSAGQLGLAHWGSDERLQALRTLRFEHLSGGAAAPLLPATGAQPMVVNLWASWCGPCRTELPLLVQAQHAHPQVRFVYVNQGESAETVRAFMAAQNLRLEPVLLDRSARLGPAVGSRGLPTTLFIGAQGEVVDAHLGIINAAALQARLARLTAASR